MSQFKDILAFYCLQHTAAEICGAEEGIMEEFDVRIKAVGASLTTELGIPFENGASLDPSTELPKPTEELFQELRVWAKQNHMF
jgi:hypothetical protein